MIFTRDRLPGVFFILTGATFAAVAMRKLPIGTASNMGPGYYPLLLSILLIAFGLAIVFGAAAEGEDPGEMIGLRPLLLIGGAPVLFALTIEPLGFLPATFLAVLAACLADRTAAFRQGLVTSIFLTAFCIAVFSYGVGIPYPLFAR